MKFSSLKYLVHDGYKNIFKNKLMSFASIGVLSACLVLIGSAVLFSLNIQKIVNNIKSQNEVIAFIKDDITSLEKNEFEKFLDNNDNILETLYISKEQALQEQLKALGDASILLEDLKNDNILPASYRIKLKDISQMRAFGENLQNRKYIEKVNMPTDIADSLVRIDELLKIFGTIVISVLIIVSLVIVSNTIKISVFSRRREINIMKYVGATNTFVRLPFIVEGAIIGALSAFISYISIYYSYNYLINIFFGERSVLANSLFNVVIDFSSVKNYVIISFLIFGIATGVLGSFLSSRKHLRV